MMNRLQYLMTKLAEEAAEIGKEAAKISQFGLDSFSPKDVNRETNAQKLRSEINDLMGIVNMLNDEFGLEYFVDDHALLAKRHKVNKYYAISQRLGMADIPDSNEIPIHVGSGIHLLKNRLSNFDIPKPVKNAIYVRRDGSKEGFVIVHCLGHERETMTVKCFTEKGWQLQDQHRWWDKVYYDFCRVESYPQWASVAESGL